jgi:7-cyano-7-deazaguanine synthase in queuosine biosynthesis
MRFVRYTGRPRAADAAYKAILSTRPLVVLDPWSAADGNIAWGFKLNGKAATVALRAHERDLFDLAAMVYVADELVPRSSGVDLWTREINLALPVAERASWEAAEPALTQCLGFLSGDVYRFEWLDRPKTVPKGAIHKLRLRPGHDVVCLFSGGVDSLLGAAALLAEGRRVLLVGHHADRITSSAQRDLFAMLRQKYPGQASLLQVYLEQSRKRRQRYALPDKVEISHRTRSFLFLVAGAIAASSTGIESVYIPENGLIALNSPLGPSRRGTLSTRTTHPRYLDLFKAAVTELGYTTRVENPFVHQSKTDMIQAVADPDIRIALQRSVSCAHAGNLWRESPAFTHCGYCVPCLYRRAAFLGAGLNESGYQHDVFTELPQLSPDKARDFRLLVRFAKATEYASEIDLIATVLRHGGFSGGPNGEDYTARAAMLKRWAGSFMDLARLRATPSARRILGL